MTKEEMLAALQELNTKAKELGIVVDFGCFGAPAIEEDGNPDNYYYIRYLAGRYPEDLVGHVTAQPEENIPFQEDVFLTKEKY